jgi:origin recognition complex subunit 6
MSRSLEPTLLSLLPTFPSASSLPPQLVELASSLLAQSRHNASTLKAEEEVARLYACAHIACERLKTTLDLPPIQARPPVPPRIYKRLYTHLDHILPASTIGKSGRIRTPSGKAREAGFAFGNGSGQRIRDRATPGKDAALAQFRSKMDRTPTKSTGKPTTPSTARRARYALPPWVKPTIQCLCTKLDSERIGRTVLAGLQTIVAPHGKRTTNIWISENLAPLLAATLFMVTTRFVMLETGKPFRGEQFANLRKDIVKALRDARKEVDEKHEDEEIFWDGWTDVGLKDFDEAITKFNESGWQDEEWFSSIQDQVGTNGDVDMGDGQGHAAGGKAQVQRGDTMLQGRWIMNDQKRQEYSRWKADILKRCDEIEKAGGVMDVDVSA